MAHHNNRRSQQPVSRPASGTVTRGNYPPGFMARAPRSFLLYINLGDSEDYAYTRKRLVDVPNRPINDEARRALEALRAEEMSAMGIPAVRPGLVDTGIQPLRQTCPYGVPRFDLRGFYGKTLSNRHYRLTEAYFQAGSDGLDGGKKRPPRLVLVFDGPESPFGALPTLSERVRDQVADFLEESSFTDGYVWDNTPAAADSFVLNCRQHAAKSQRYVRFTDNWVPEVVEL